MGIIDVDSIQSRKDSFIEEELKDVYADLLFSAQLNDKECYFYFLFEHKSSKEKTIAFDLLHYMQEIWKTLINKEKMMEVPHIIPILFYQGESEWSDVRTIGDWIKGYHQFSEKVQRYSPNFDFILVDMSPKANTKITGMPKLQAYLELTRHIFVQENEIFYQAIGLIEQLLIDYDTRYLETIFIYILSARKDVNTEEVKKQLTPKGGVKMISAADRLRQEGKLEGKLEGIFEEKVNNAKKMFRLGMNEEQIKQVTELSSAEIAKIKEDLARETQI